MTTDQRTSNPDQQEPEPGAERYASDRALEGMADVSPPAAGTAEGLVDTLTCPTDWLPQGD